MALECYKIAARCPDGDIAGIAQLKFIETSKDNINKIDNVGDELPNHYGQEICRVAINIINNERLNFTIFDYNPINLKEISKIYKNIVIEYIPFLYNSYLEEHYNTITNNQENNDEDDDEFYDCEESESNIQEETFKPDGRSKKFGKLTLLNNPNEYIYVPITQEPTPMTEDMIEQHASVLVNLGFSYFLRKIYLDYKNI